MILVPMRHYSSPAPTPEDEISRLDLIRLILAQIKRLHGRERKIIIMKYFGDRTQKEIGEIFGVTGQRIRQQRIKAIRKLRHPARSYSLRDYY